MSAVAQTSVFIQPVGFMTSQWRTETGLQLTVYKQYGDRSSNWYFKVLADDIWLAVVTLFRDDYCPKHARLAVQ